MTAQTKTFSELISFTRASNATYFDSAGVLRRAASNVSRIDYNPSTLAVRGLLVEEQRTNLLTYSEDFNNAAWPKIRCSISPNATTAPNGSLSADKIIENTDNNTHAIERNTTGLTGGATYTQTIFVKAAERTSVVIGSWDGTTGIDNQFNLSTGTVVVSGAGTIAASIDSVGSGWYRCRVTRAIAAGSTQLSLVVYTHNGTSNIYAGDGTSGFFIWGAQIELGAFPTSYIPSSVTFSGRTSSGTYFDSTGTLQTAGSGVSRTTYNPSNLTAEPFLLLEESRTNSIRNNTMAGAAVGTPGTLPTNWAQYFAPTGITRTVVGTGTRNGITYIDIRLSGTASGAGELSIQFEQTSALLFSAATVLSQSAWFAIVGGSTSNITSTTFRLISWLGASYLSEASTVVTLSSSLTRVSLNNYTTASTSDRALSLISVNVAAAGAIDITLRIGMPQLEQGAYPTSVISTSSAAVTRAADTSTSATATRAADVASINFLDPWYNDREGTILSEVQMLAAPLPSAGIPFALTAEGSSHMALRMRPSQKAGASVVDTSVTVVDTASAANYTTTISKLSFGYLLNDFASSLNGESPAVDTTGTVPIFTNCNVGSMAGSAYLNGWIRNIKYYPRRLTNAELQAITT